LHHYIEGVPLRLDLANPAQTSVNFGSLRGGQSATREVGLCTLIQVDP
jgi:hypothetical protein